MICISRSGGRPFRRNGGGAFKEAMESEEKTEIGGIPVKVSSHRVTDQYEPFDSALELKALPCLSTLICERWHPDLLEFLREKPLC